MYKTQADNLEQEKVRNLYNWLMQGNASFTKLAIEIQSPGRRNVVSTKSIKRGETIVYIPKAQIISLETIRGSAIIQNILKHKIKLHSPKHSLLAIYLLEQKRSQNSPFKSYIDILPVDCSNFPIFYSQEEMKELKGSPLFEAIDIRKFEIQSDFRSLMDNDIGIKVEYSEFCWARMVVCSRIFGIVIGEQKTDALVPFADMLNHGVNKQTIWSYSNQREGFVIQALQGINKGVQIYDSYGRKSNSRFLLNYGFVIDGNQSDEITIKLKIDRRIKSKLQEICEDDPSRFLFKLGLEFDNTCMQELISTIRFILDVQIRQEPEVEEEQSNKTTFREPLNLFSTCEVEFKCWQYLGYLLSQLLGEYPTDLQFDIDKLQREEDELSFNCLNCLKLRIGEKKILEHYIQICSRMQNLFENNGKSFKRNWKKKTYKECEEYLYKINCLLP